MVEVIIGITAGTALGIVVGTQWTKSIYAKKRDAHRREWWEVMEENRAVREERFKIERRKDRLEYELAQLGVEV